MRAIPVLILFLGLIVAPFARAGDDYVLTIKDNRFEPAELAIPADTKVKLTVRNADSTPEEFESSDLNREKVVVPGGAVTVFVGPLSAGRYEFFGDFHPDTARGHIVVQ
jgi:plastocyanin